MSPGSRKNSITIFRCRFRNSQPPSGDESEPRDDHRTKCCHLYDMYINEWNTNGQFDHKSTSPGCWTLRMFTVRLHLKLGN